MHSISYPKTENLFKRDPDTHKLIEGELRLPEFGIPARWHVTEKIDGTNIRVVYKPATAQIEVRGRTDRATVPKDLEQWILDRLSPESLFNQFAEFMGDERIRAGACVTIFGEGYGPGIQKGGGRYADEKRFRVFDVMYHWPLGMVDDDETATYGMVYKDSWCQPSTTRMIAENLGLPLAPALFTGTIGDIVSYVRSAIHSMTALKDKGAGGRSAFRPEGVVARTDPYLYTERGSRLMFKLKGEDLDDRS